MAMRDLLTSLRVDLGDEDGLIISETRLVRCLHKAAYGLARDLQMRLAIEEGEIVPEPAGEERELLLLLARIYVCQVMRTTTSSGFSFASGDKRVDKTRQASNWVDLEADLWKLYRSRLGDLDPETTQEDEYFIHPRMTPVIYEQGSRRRSWRS